MRLLFRLGPARVFAWARKPATSDICQPAATASPHCFRGIPTRRQSSQSSLIQPSIRQRVLAVLPSMTTEEAEAGPTLDRSKFSETLTLKALRVEAAQCQNLVKSLSGHTLNKPRLKSVFKDVSDPKKRLILLNDSIKGAELAGLPEHLQSIVRDSNIEVVDHDVTLDYSYWPTDHILKKLLPEGSEIPSAFETVGHIAHLNIRDELIPYKHVIGQVIIDKNPHIQTVVNKVGTINNEYRVFDMEVVAGRPDFQTEVVQHKARFRLDFSKVYWNSRLEHEHLRLVQSFSKHDIILDVMAGIGPFAIPAAQKGWKVFANDLNPDSYKFLQENVRLNKVADRVNMYNIDGREFIRSLSKPGGPLYSQVIMNLPASAVTFLDAFSGACADPRWQGRLPTINCYTFSKGDETEAGVRERVEAALGGPLDSQPTIHLVREVAPNKRMLCITFKLPVGVAAAGADAQQAEAAEPPCKKARTTTPE